MVMPMNFYGMGPGMGMGMGMDTGLQGSGNVYANVKARYGCGYMDFGERPKIGAYPVDTIPQATPRLAEKTWLGRVLKKLCT